MGEHLLDKWKEFAGMRQLSGLSKGRERNLENPQRFTKYRLSKPHMDARTGI